MTRKEYNLICKGLSDTPPEAAQKAGQKNSNRRQE